VIPPDASAGLCGQHGRRAGGLSEARTIPQRPLVCLDENLEAAESSRTRAPPIPREAGTQRRGHDYEYERNGVRQSVHGVRPRSKGGGMWKVTDRHHRHRLCPYAQGFVGRAFSRRGEEIVLVQDNLNTHKPRLAHLRSLPRRRGAPARRALRVALHPPSTAVGSTWPKPNSACSRRSSV